jgi:hypothetical protein
LKNQTGVDIMQDIYKVSQIGLWWSERRFHDRDFVCDTRGYRQTL